MPPDVLLTASDAGTSLRLSLPSDLSDASLVVATVVAVVDVVLRVVALAVVPRDRRPSSAMAWLILIFFVPSLGVVAYLLIGSPKLPRARREKQASMNRLIEEAARGADDVVEEHPWPPWVEGVTRLNHALGAMPLLSSNDAHIIPDYRDQLRELAEGVAKAQRYVHVEFYILSYDDATAPVFAALEDAVARGVTVRVLLDHIGSWRYPGYKRAVRELDRIGVQWRLMLPVQPLRGRYQRPDLRNHRKLVVVDGETAFVGSLNLIDRTYDKRATIKRGLLWQDLLVRLHGPVVHEVDALFVTDWYSETDEVVSQATDHLAPPDPGRRLHCQVVPSGPGFEGQNNLKLFNALLYGASRRVSITSPYFVPDESLLTAVTTAAERGVEVELFVGAIGDQVLVFHAQRSYYEALLRAGVRIWLYPAPYVLHAKHMSVDDDVAVVGSSNMDIRSFELDLELTLLVLGREFTDELRRVEDDYRSRSTELTLEAWSGRGFWRRLADDLARLTSAVQ
ncbi:cardiolipin synthase [Pseudokineococcus marinus]|uniref:Cardiolipin synthase n=1 Tax=Pseudokineococcus marinus TaxID=351215 RepID=A0A849C2W3_9ACTN|nr:cardiolipin synthase [Pseudokineococcus marinus]NNH23988.1 cardiolipin synthase [Pseudokineococcus marinus]